MRPLLVGLAIFSATGVLFAACSQGPGSSAAGTSSSAGGAGGVEATGATGSTGGAPNCEGIYFVYDDYDGGEPCDICLHDKCCAEIADCRDKDCIKCVNHLLPSCGHAPRVVNNCLYLHCQPVCSPGWPPSASSATGEV